MKTYVTFGRSHIHKFNGKIFDSNCVAVIICDSDEDGRKKAFELFGRKWAFEYHEDRFDESWMEYYPRGFINVGINS